MRVALLLPLLLVGCTDPNMGPDDGEAEGAGAIDPTAVSSVAGFVGLHAAPAGTHEDGDVIALEMRVTPQPTGPARFDYIRARCYGTSCARKIPETDHYDVYTSSAGKTYVRFWTVTIDRDHGNAVSTPQLADVYEIKMTAGDLQLRKSYTNRWVTLGHSTDAAQCTGSGGTWGDLTCSCAGTSHFFAGAGGCVAIGSSSESKCDASGGLWTDDDATLLGEYCICGAGHYTDANGSCATIDP